MLLALCTIHIEISNLSAVTFKIYTFVSKESEISLPSFSSLLFMLHQKRESIVKRDFVVESIHVRNLPKGKLVHLHLVAYRLFQIRSTNTSSTLSGFKDKILILYSLLYYRLRLYFLLKNEKLSLLYLAFYNKCECSYNDANIKQQTCRYLYRYIADTYRMQNYINVRNL